MSNSVPITTPGGYAPAYAVGFANPSEKLILVSEESRLPVATAAPAGPALTGQASVSQVVGPFDGVADRVVSVALDGDWQGTTSLLRSTDGGATKVPLRVAGEQWGVYLRSGYEQAWLESEDGASYYLDISLTSGTLTYRVSQ